jgi:hypothetical protein
MSRFLNETNQTTLLPPPGTELANKKKADAAEQIALAAQGKRTTAKRRGLSTLTDIEEIIGALVKTEATEGYFPLLPHTEAGLYHCVGASATHLDMLKESGMLGTVAADATPEKWRRFPGQQMVLLTELITFCVPAHFQDNGALINPLGKRKARGTVRSDLTLHSKLFVLSRARTNTAAVRRMALEYTRLARVSDVDPSSQSTDLFTLAAGITLPAAHDEKTVLMLKDPTLTPTGALLSFCTDIIMQVQCAARLGRLPSISSILVPTTASEMDLFKLHSSCVIESDTPTVSMAQLHSAVQLTVATAPPAVADFVKIAFQQGDTLHPYYGLPRLARSMFKPNEEVAASTLNSVNARFRALLNGFRVLNFPSTEPLFQVLDGLHRPYQVGSVAAATLSRLRASSHELTSIFSHARDAGPSQECTATGDFCRYYTWTAYPQRSTAGCCRWRGLDRSMDSSYSQHEADDAQRNVCAF